jgi:hypothetical protein
MSEVCPGSGLRRVSARAAWLLVLMTCLVAGCSATDSPPSAGPPAEPSDEHERAATGPSRRATPPETARAEEAVEPTRANTGPTVPPTDTITVDKVLRTGTCENKRVIGDFRVEEWSNDSSMLGRTFRFDNCIFENFHWVAGDGSYAVDRYPVFEIKRTHFRGSHVLLSPVRMSMTGTRIDGGAFWSPCPDCASSAWEVEHDMPVHVRDSLFLHPKGVPPDHTEPLHALGSGVGASFTNVAFVQEGPMNNTATGAIKAHWKDTIYDGCWFKYENGIASYYTVYIEGTGTVVKNSMIEKGKATFIYPEYTTATFVDNHDLRTGAPIGS